jgi:carboxymethylenebutenolidase
LYRSMTAEEIRFTGDADDELNAYFARPAGAGAFGGVIVIHHMPGWDEQTMEITRKFADHGYLALCPNLHHRDAPGASPDDAAAASRASGGVPDDRFLGDMRGAIAYLRSLEDHNGKVGVIGFCSGGRQAFLAACSIELEAAVDCYGGFVVGEPPPGMPANIRPVLHLAENLSCPLLGLFGQDDQHPSPAEVDQLEAELKRLGKQYEFHRFEGAGHGFFAADRTMYRPEAATEGWKLIFSFFGRHLAG